PRGEARAERGPRHDQRPPRRDGPPRFQGKGGPRDERRDERRDRRPRDDRQEGRSYSFAPAREKGPDPDSPFAVLARLKLGKD
ncbi:hypothetical protein, partial [Teichococcus aerofrigidensis]